MTAAQNSYVFTDGEVSELLRWKDRSFTALIQTLELPISLHKSVVLAGGVYTNWHHKEKIKDIDVFILSDGHEATTLAYLKSKIGSIFDPNAFKNASDYKRDNTNIEEVYNAMAILPRVLYQFIFTKYKTREELISHFDFLHCTPNYYNSNLYVRKDAFEAIRDKRLVVHNKDNQVEWRRHKFLTHRGFTEHEHMTYNLGSGGHVPWSRYSKNIAQNA